MLISLSSLPSNKAAQGFTLHVLGRAGLRLPPPSRRWLAAGSPRFAARRASFRTHCSRASRRAGQSGLGPGGAASRWAYKYRAPMAASGFPLLPAAPHRPRPRKTRRGGTGRDGLLPLVTPRAGLLARPCTPLVRCCSLAPGICRSRFGS